MGSSRLMRGPRPGHRRLAPAPALAETRSFQDTVKRQPLIPLGPRGSFDCGLTIVAAQPVRWHDRVLVFYHGRATVHDGQPRFPADTQPDPINGIGLAEFSPALLES